MKKINNKGFVLAETLIVTIFVMTIFTIIYINFYPQIAEYQKREFYDDVDSKYDIFWFKRILESQKVTDATWTSIKTGIKNGTSSTQIKEITVTGNGTLPPMNVNELPDHQNIKNYGYGYIATGYNAGYYVAVHNSAGYALYKRTSNNTGWSVIGPQSTPPSNNDGWTPAWNNRNAADHGASAWIEGNTNEWSCSGLNTEAAKLCGSYASKTKLKYLYVTYYHLGSIANGNSRPTGYNESMSVKTRILANNSSLINTLHKDEDLIDYIKYLPHYKFDSLNEADYRIIAEFERDFGNHKKYKSFATIEVKR